MFDRILVALDGSEYSEKTLPYAELIAGKLGSEIVLLEIEGEHEGRTVGGKAYLDGLASKLTGSGNRTRVVLLKGKAAEGIIDYAAQNAVGLIIMAAHGRSGVTRWAVGSVADKVMRATRVPMALINGDSKKLDKGELLRKALLPLDGSKVGEAALPYAEELALKMGTELVLLQVLEFKYIAYGAEVGGYLPYPQDWLTAAEDSAKAYLSGIERRLQAKGISVTWRVESGSAPDAIIQIAEQTGASFVAMSTHGRSGVGRFVLGSVADRVLHAGKTPVFLVSAKSR